MVEFELEPAKRPVLTGANAIVIHVGVRVFFKNPE
jgi:hypothetical protein